MRCVAASPATSIRHLLSGFSYERITPVHRYERGTPVYCLWVKGGRVSPATRIRHLSRGYLAYKKKPAPIGPP